MRHYNRFCREEALRVKRWESVRVAVEDLSESHADAALRTILNRGGIDLGGA